MLRSRRRDGVGVRPRGSHPVLDLVAERLEIALRVELAEHLYEVITFVLLYGHVLYPWFWWRLAVFNISETLCGCQLQIIIIFDKKGLRNAVTDAYRREGAISSRG